LKPPFDIAGDLDTPVSAFAKLAAFNPRFLLESVEGGERLARYSFIGFGKCLEVRLDAAGLKVGDAVQSRPKDQGELLGALRQALARAPKPLPEMAGVPLAGGLVGYSSYDVVRYFERLPSKARADAAVPDLHYVAPQSMLVFDHLTRGIALLHAGSEAERASLRREVVRALRGALPNHAASGDEYGARYSEARRSTSPRATSTNWCCRRVSRAGIRSIPSRPTARCASSILRRTCTTASSATSPSWAPRRKRWSR
jgi:anthranilate synthase component 1